jgi:hypothetical protein
MGGKVYMPIVIGAGQKTSQTVLDKGKLTIVPGHEYLAVIILILLTILTGYVSSKMMSNDPKQAKMMALMPVIFGVFAWILPAGVTLYIVTTNILMIVQQYVQLEAEGFYDDKRTQRLKSGEPLNWYERYRYRGYDYGSMLLTAVRIKRPEELAARQAATVGDRAPRGGKAAAGKAERPRAAKNPARPKPASERGALGQKPRPPGQTNASKHASAPKQAATKESNGSRATGTARLPKVDRPRHYPAKKKASGRK